MCMGVPAVMVDEKGNRIPGEVPFGDILQHPERHSQAVMQPFYRTPEFCAACHKANLPNALNDYKFIRAFTVYDEWQNSKFSNRNPLTFYHADFTTCQNCHMHRARDHAARLWRKEAECWPRIAGWRETRRCRSITASTSNCRRRLSS